jgi:hypothetical protein
MNVPPSKNGGQTYTGYRHPFDARGDTNRFDDAGRSKRVHEADPLS